MVKVHLSVSVLVQEQVLVEVCDSVEDRYRFGFNGMYKDNEMKGIGNSLDFGARLYDSRVGRWLSIDPMAALQPSQSTYKAFLNNPIIMADPDGKKEYITTINYDERTGNTTVKIHTGNTIMTDGVKHRIWDNSVDYHWENNYYDYSTVIYQTTN